MAQQYRISGQERESQEREAAKRQPYPWASVFRWIAWVFAAAFVSGVINARSHPFAERLVGGIFVGLIYALLTGMVVGTFKYFRRGGAPPRLPKEEATPLGSENTNKRSSNAIQSDGDVTDDQEERLYKQIAQEIETRTVDKALWIKAFAQAEGNETQTRVLYIKARFARLLDMESGGIGN